jgi:MFS family permease
MSSEMIYPLLPVFLSTVLGAGVISIGIIEGVAETTASILKVVSGIWADRVSRRKPLVVFGYTLAGMARPLIGLATGWTFVLVMRFIDRVGKGFRTSPRDALIADAVSPATRGAAYGFQRAMDHAGAVMGPLVAAGLMMMAGLSLRSVFLFAALPAAIVIVVLIVGIRESPRAREKAPESPRIGHFAELGRGFHLYLLALLIFTLGNSSDAFILLRLSDSGVPAAWVALLWSAHHVIKMTSAYLGGSLSDRIGRKRVVLAGWALYGLVYIAFAAFSSVAALIVIFLVYGLYFGLTEPTERAWVIDMVPGFRRGAALGYYHGTVGIAALPASLIFGWIWKQFGAHAAFGTGAVLALVAAFLLARVPDNPAQ